MAGPDLVNLPSLIDDAKFFALPEFAVHGHGDYNTLI